MENNETVEAPQEETPKVENTDSASSFKEAFLGDVKPPITTDTEQKEKSSLETEKISQEDENKNVTTEKEVVADTEKAPPVEEKPVEEQPTDEDEYEELSFDDIQKELNVFAEEQGWPTYEDMKHFKSVDFTNHNIDTDPNAVSEGETIKAFLELKNPNLTEAQFEAKMIKFDALFEDREAILLADLSDDEKRAKNAELIALEAEFDDLLQEAETFLSAEQEKIDLDVKLQRKKEKAAEQKIQTPEDVKKILTEQLSASFKSINDDTFKIIDGSGKEVTAVKYVFTDEDKAKAIEAGSLGYNRWTIMENGKVVGFDDQKFAKEMAYLSNMEQIHSVIFNEGKAQGAEKEIKEINNIDFEKRTNPSAQPTTPSMAAQAGWK